MSLLYYYGLVVVIIITLWLLLLLVFLMCLFQCCYICFLLFYFIYYWLFISTFICSFYIVILHLGVFGSWCLMFIFTLYQHSNITILLIMFALHIVYFVFLCQWYDVVFDLQFNLCFTRLLFACLFVCSFTRLLQHAFVLFSTHNIICFCLCCVLISKKCVLRQQE